MKLISTGMVRRIDDLGRVVIPKSIRQKLGIHEGDSLELFETDDGGIYLILCNVKDDERLKTKI